MERIIFPIKSFIAYVEYLPENAQLNVILKLGNLYAYNVSQNEFNAIKTAKRKGSYTSTFCRNKKSVFMGIVSKQQIKQNINLTKYLAQ